MNLNTKLARVCAIRPRESMERIGAMFHCDCHYTCDVCQRVLDAERDQRCVLRITDSGDGGGDDGDQSIEYDLCSECRQRFMHDPLGRRLAPSLDFSKN